MISIFCVILLAGNITNLICSQKKNSKLMNFSHWMYNHNKTYLQEEIGYKYRNWDKNKKIIDNHNSEERGFTLGLNQFADISQIEWFMRRNNLNNKMTQTLNVQSIEYDKDPTLPTSIDWRDKGVVTGIKNQQQCGSCWAFSAVGSMEGQHALKTNNLVSLSESQIVDCDVNGGDEGCNGGWMDGAFTYVINNTGIESEKDYPYDPLDDPCKFNKSEVVATFSNYSDVLGGEEGLKRAVARVGPISVAIDAGTSSFQFYKKGVYYEPNCSPTMLDHGVLVVGYGTTLNGTDYWIVKNSWGETWGDKGYIYMSRNRNNNCGIASKPSYPIV